MNSTLYYGEIAALISGKFHNNPDHLLRIGHILGKDNKKDTIWSFCANAANVFDKVEDLSSDLFINSHHAVDLYSKDILDVLLSGRTPNVVDMVSMSANSIRQTL